MAQVWDVREKRVRPFALLHNAQVWGMATNSTCDRIVTASADHTARVWDAVIGKPLSPPLLHNGGVSDVAFSHDGKHILTSSWDHRVRLWPVIEPVPDEPERVTNWIETMTGMKFGVTGSSELLTSEEWSERKKRLEELGGPPWTSVRAGASLPRTFTCGTSRSTRTIRTRLSPPTSRVWHWPATAARRCKKMPGHPPTA
jgi:WD40 repeat protein